MARKLKNALGKLLPDYLQHRERERNRRAARQADLAAAYRQEAPRQLNQQFRQLQEVDAAVIQRALREHFAAAAAAPARDFYRQYVQWAPMNFQALEKPVGPVLNSKGEMML